MAKRFIPPTWPPPTGPTLPFPWPPTGPTFPFPWPPTGPTFPPPPFPLPANAEEEFAEFVEKFARKNPKLIERRYREAGKDSVEAARLFLCDVGLDKNVPKESYFVITGTVLAGWAISFTAGVIVGVLISK